MGRVEYPDKVVQKKFTSEDARINIDYPTHGNMTTYLSANAKTIFATTATIEVVSYTYTNTKKQ